MFFSVKVVYYLVLFLHGFVCRRLCVLYICVAVTCASFIRALPCLFGPGLASVLSERIYRMLRLIDGTAWRTTNLTDMNLCFFNPNFSVP